MTLCPIDPTDADRLLEVWNRAAEFDPLNGALLHEKLWGDADFDASLALAWRGARDIQAFGIAVCRPLRGQLTGFIKMIAVEPAAQRKGIGTALYQALERRCRELGAVEMRLGESAPNYLVPGVDKRYRPAIAFFEQHGLVRSGEACNQRVDLRRWSYAPPGDQPEAAGGKVAYCRATPDHAAAIREFLDENWPTWWAEVSTALANEPPSLFLALDGDKVVGFAAHNGNNRGSGWFGPMGTSPTHRGLGIGGRLLALCLADMQQAGYPSAIIPWVGPVQFYREQAGAVVDREFVRYTKQLAASTP